MIRQRQKTALVLAVALAVALTGCAGLNLPTVTKETLTVSTTIYKEGTTAIGLELKQIPLANVAERKPYIQALAALEKVRVINNAIATAAMEAALRRSAPDPRFIERMDDSRWDAIIEHVPLLIKLGVKIYNVVK